MTIRQFYRRRFLNRPRHHEGAHVIAEVKLQQYGESWGITAGLHLADCYHHAKLDFDASNRAEARNALYKVAVLREVLADFETSLRAAVEEMEQRNPRR